MRERAAAKWTRENSQEKKLRLWARREGSGFEVPGRKPTGRSGNLNRRVQSRRDSENPPTRSAGGHLTTADLGLRKRWHPSISSRKTSDIIIVSFVKKHGPCLVPESIYLLARGANEKRRSHRKDIFCRQWHESWKYPRRTKRPQRSGGTVICTRVPLIRPFTATTVVKGESKDTFSICLDILHCSVWNGRREWPANLGWWEARCSQVSVSKIL